jgi:hypothetical protein
MKINDLFHVPMAFAIVILPLILTGISARADNAAPVATAKSISKVPYVISTPGTYIVKKDLVLASATGRAITVAANDVTLDLGGHVISSSAPQDGANSSYGVYANGTQNITVRNGVLRNFSRGVSLQRSDIVGKFLVEDMAVENSGSIGIAIQSAVDGEVRGCRVLETGYQSATIGSQGITVVANNVKIIGNVVGNLKKLGAVSAYGINCGVQRSGLVDKNVVTAATTGSYGIYCGALSSSAVMAVENVVESFTTGILFDGAGKYRGNLTYNCSAPFTGGTAIGGENN